MPKLDGKVARQQAALAACCRSPKAPLTDVRGSVDSVRNRAATVRKRALPPAARGIGLAAATAPAKEGAFVYVTRSRERELGPGRER